MTDSSNQQPMTRRERRLLEQEGTLAPSPDSHSPSASEVTPPLDTPAVPPAPEPATPLTRRERRLLEAHEGGVPEAVSPQDTVGQPITSPTTQQHALPEEAADTALTELLPLATESAAASAEATPPKPLPPVFGYPVSSQANLAQLPEPGAPFVDFNPNRTVGSVPSATSSLILPSAPSVDLAGPLGDTGEIVVTGQIRLPTSLAERGGAPSLVEDRDHDEVMDAYVTGAIAATAKPVRASQAVSGKGDDTDIVLVRRARWGTATVVTGLAAGVLGLAALGLLVLAMLTDVLG